MGRLKVCVFFDLLGCYFFGVVLLMEEIRLTNWYGKYPIIYRVLYIQPVVGLGISEPSKQSHSDDMHFFRSLHKRPTFEHSSLKPHWSFGSTCLNHWTTWCITSRFAMDMFILLLPISPIFSSHFWSVWKKPNGSSFPQPKTCSAAAVGPWISTVNLRILLKVTFFGPLPGHEVEFVELTTWVLVGLGGGVSPPIGVYPHFWVLVWVVVFHTNQFEGVELMKPCKVLTA